MTNEKREIIFLVVSVFIMIFIIFPLIKKSVFFSEKKRIKKIIREKKINRSVEIRTMIHREGIAAYGGLFFFSASQEATFICNEGKDDWEELSFQSKIFCAEVFLEAGINVKILA